MRFVVCFRCIQVLTAEEIHNCLPSDDDEDNNDWLLIDYELPVHFNQDFIKCSRKANVQARGGDFNFLPSNQSASINDYSWLAPNTYANSSAEYSSPLAPNKLLKIETRDEFLNPVEQNRSLSEYNSHFQSGEFANTSFNEHPVFERIRTRDSSIFSSSRNFYQDFAKYSAAKDMPSSSLTASGFNSGDLEKSTCPISATNRHLGPDFLNVNMQRSTREKNICSTPLYNKSKPSTSGYIKKYSVNTDPAPRRRVYSQPSSDNKSRNNIPSENISKDEIFHSVK